MPPVRFSIKQVPACSPGDEGTVLAIITMLDTCTQVGCLRQAGIADLHAVPEGDWFCSEECSVCKKHLEQQVGAMACVVGFYLPLPPSSTIPCLPDPNAWTTKH